MLSLILLAALSTPPAQQQHPTMTMAQINAQLHADDGEVGDINRQMQIANFEMHYALCEIAWHRTSFWKKWRKYHFDDPCKQAVKNALK